MLIFLVAAALQQAAAQSMPAFDAAQAVVSPPRVVAQFEGSAVKGEPVGLAWSSDSATLYLRSAEYDRWRNETAFHFIVPAAGGAPAAAGAVPPWAAIYWLWKSGQSAPGVPDMKLETEAQSQIATAAGSVRDDGISQSRADPSQSQISSDVASAQRVTKTTVRLKGTVIVEAVNKSVAPGSSWGWAPAPLGGLAFIDGKKRLVLIDRSGRTLAVPGVTDAMLPAWSPDGRQIAFLQKKGRKNFVLSVVEVGAR